MPFWVSQQHARLKNQNMLLRQLRNTSNAPNIIDSIVRSWRFLQHKCTYSRFYNHLHASLTFKETRSPVSGLRRPHVSLGGLDSKFPGDEVADTPYRFTLLFVYMTLMLLMAFLETTLLLKRKRYNWGDETIVAETYIVSWGQHVSKQNGQYSDWEFAYSCIGSLLSMDW